MFLRKPCFAAGGSMVGSVVPKKNKEERGMGLKIESGMEGKMGNSGSFSKR